MLYTYIPNLGKNLIKLIIIFKKDVLRLVKTYLL